MSRFFSKIFYCLIITLGFFLTACDEGRLNVEEPVVTHAGGVAKFTGHLSGMDSWPSDYSIALAGFKEGNDFALISKNLTLSTPNGKCDVVLSGISSEVNTIELCVIDRLRRRVATFASSDYVGENDTTMLLPTETLNISMAHIIQRDILNTTCANCHGRSTHAAAGLNLTENHSFQEMVNMESSKISGTSRIVAGNADESLLYQILAYGKSADWNYDHSVEILRQEKLDLIKNWINAGAKY